MNVYLSIKKSVNQLTGCTFFFFLTYGYMPYTIMCWSGKPEWNRIPALKDEQTKESMATLWHITSYDGIPVEPVRHVLTKCYKEVMLKLNVVDE